MLVSYCRLIWYCSARRYEKLRKHDVHVHNTSLKIGIPRKGNTNKYHVYVNGNPREVAQKSGDATARVNTGARVTEIEDSTALNFDDFA